MSDHIFYKQANGLALLTRLKQELKRFEHPPVPDPDRAFAQNLLTSIQWYTRLSNEEKEKRAELTKGIQKAVDSLVELLRRIKDPNAKAPVDDQFRRTRWLAAELIGYLTRANHELLLLSRPVKTYRGVPEELVALVFGMDAEEFHRYERQLPEMAKGPWSMKVSYVIDLFARGPVESPVERLAVKGDG